jgi:hypothetical protein
MIFDALSGGEAVHYQNLIPTAAADINHHTGGAGLRFENYWNAGLLLRRCAQLPQAMDLRDTAP